MNEWIDNETIPYHKRKHPVVPRGVRLSALIENFFTNGPMNEYAHVVLDVQLQEFEINFNETLDQLMINLLNDISFYPRFMPGVNLQRLVGNQRKPDEDEGLSFKSVSLTRNSIMKHYQ